MRAALPLIVLALAAALAAGCGRGTASLTEYTATVRAARDRVDAALAQVTVSQSEDELFTRLDVAADVTERASNDLAHARVAKGLGDENHDLADALDTLSRQIAGIAAQLQDPTFGSALENMQGLSFPAFVSTNRILRKLRSEGVKVEPLLPHKSPG